MEGDRCRPPAAGYPSQSSLYWSRVGRSKPEVPTAVSLWCRNPHCTGAGLEVLNAKHWSVFFNPVAILIVLEQGWKAEKAHYLALPKGRNPHCTGAGLEVPSEHRRTGARAGSQSSLYWSRVGRLLPEVRTDPFLCRNPHCTGAGLEAGGLFAFYTRRF